MHPQAQPGRVIGLTRDVDDRAAFADLEAAGWRLVRVPLTTQRATDGARGLPPRLLALQTNDDLVFTSANAVHVARQALDDAGIWPLSIRARVWAVGPATAEAVRERLDVEPSFVADEASADGLLELAARVGVAGRSFLFPAASGARRTLPDGLRRLGATVDQVTCYTTIDHPDAVPALRAATAAGLGLVTLASPSAAASLARACAVLGLHTTAITVAAIGPTTAEAAREDGFRVAVVATEYTMPGLAQAIAAAHVTLA